MRTYLDGPTREKDIAKEIAEKVMKKTKRLENNGLYHKLEGCPSVELCSGAYLCIISLQLGSRKHILRN